MDGIVKVSGAGVESMADSARLYAKNSSQKNLQNNFKIQVIILKVRVKQHIQMKHLRKRQSLNQKEGVFFNHSHHDVQNCYTLFIFLSYTNKKYFSTVSINLRCIFDLYMKIYGRSTLLFY